MTAADNKPTALPEPGYRGLAMAIIERAAADRTIRRLECNDGHRSGSPERKKVIAEVRAEASQFFFDGRFKLLASLAGFEVDGMIDRLKRESAKSNTQTRKPTS